MEPYYTFYYITVFLPAHHERENKYETSCNR